MYVVPRRGPTWGWGKPGRGMGAVISLIKRLPTSTRWHRRRTRAWDGQHRWGRRRPCPGSCTDRLDVLNHIRQVFVAQHTGERRHVVLIPVRHPIGRQDDLAHISL